MSDLLSHDVLVVSQKAKLIELTNEYRIRDENGEEIGVIRQEGQSKARKVLRLVSSLDQFLTHRLSVYDAAGDKVAALERPAKFLKSTVNVSDGTGKSVGRIVQQNVVGKKRFALETPDGQALGSINAINLISWDFSIQDPTGTEVGRITKKWSGILREGFTTADNYMVQITGTVSPELRLMIVAAGAGVDTALKQDDSSVI